jgi:hypothetical protein
LRQVLVNHAELARKRAELERRIEGHDEAIRSIFEAIRQIMGPPAADQPVQEIGFHVKEEPAPYRIRRRRRRLSSRQPGSTDSERRRTSGPLTLNSHSTNIEP